MKIPALHKAVIDNDRHYIIHHQELAYERDCHGFTAKELALFLGKLELASLLGYRAPEGFLLEGEFFPLGVFEEKLGFAYTPSLTFESYDHLLEAIRQCPLTFGFFERKWKNVRESKARLSINCIDKAMGFGLFSEELIDNGAFIGEYAGAVEKISKESKHKDTMYMLHYPTRFFSWHPYVIDAKNCGNITRFINHSQKPNLSPEFIVDRSLVHISFFAKQSIMKGEELTIDYGKDYWVTRGWVHQKI